MAKRKDAESRPDRKFNRALSRLAKRCQPKPKLGRTELNHIPILKSNALGNSRSVNEQGRFRLVLGDDPLFPCILQREMMRPNTLGLAAVMAIIRLAKREGKTARLYLLLRCIPVQPFDANLQKILELLEDDQSPTSKWAGVASKKTLQQGKLTLKEYLPQLQALLDAENLKVGDKILFTAEKMNGQFTITEIKSAP